MSEPNSENTNQENTDSFNSANKGRDYEVYTNSMDAALEAKARSIFPHFGFLPEGAVIVDVGSGTGALAELAARDFRGAKVYALDKSHELMERAEGNQALTHIVFGDAAEKNFPDNSVDVMYFSTVGHEIESFGGEGKMGVAMSVGYDALKPGGKVIVRDFEKPQRTEPVFMQIITDDGEDDLEKVTTDGVIDYNRLSTKALFKRFHQEFRGGNAFEYEIVKSGDKEYIKLASEWAHEFYLRKDYTGNWGNEIEEKYTYWNPLEAKKQLEDCGYTDIQVIPDPNEYILNNRLRGKIALFEADVNGNLNPIDFPTTHMVVVGTKPKDPAEILQKVEIEKEVDYQSLKDTISFDEEQGVVKIGDINFNVSKDRKPARGNKKDVFFLPDGKVLKVIRKDGLNTHSTFIAMFQSIAREKLLDEKNIPHMRILETDPEGPPYRYFIQEAVPKGSESAADLIKNHALTEKDIEQISSYINNFELGKKWQLDTNPFNWYRVHKTDGSTEMTYIDGKIYPYDDGWEFKKVGLLQWLYPEYVSGETVHSAVIPKKAKFNEVSLSWTTNEDPQVTIWKKYLHPNLQPTN